MINRVVFGLAIFGLIAVGTFVYRDHLQLPASNLQVGDCFDAPTVEGPVSDLLHHPCTEAHTGEVYAVFTYPENAVSGVLGRTDGVLLSHCDAAFHDYTGVVVAKRKDLSEAFIQPTADGWKNGDRVITCYLHSANGKPTTHSERKLQPSLLPNG